MQCWNSTALALSLAVCPWCVAMAAASPNDQADQLAAVLVAPPQPTGALVAWTRYGQGASANFPDACIRMCCKLRPTAEWEARNVDAFTAQELGRFHLAANDEKSIDR
jgi:hypothetical protein